MGVLNVSYPISNPNHGDDSMIHDLPMRNAPGPRLNIAEALRSYADMKRRMLTTIEHGLNDNSNPASRNHTIANLVSELFNVPYSRY